MKSEQLMKVIVEPKWKFWLAKLLGDRIPIENAEAYYWRNKIWIYKFEE